MEPQLDAYGAPLTLRGVLSEETPDEVIEIEDVEQQPDDKPMKNKRNYKLTDARKAALQKAREKKTDYAKAGREVVKKGNKKVAEDAIEIEEEVVAVAPKRTIVKKQMPPPLPPSQQIGAYGALSEEDDEEEQMYQSHQRLKEEEIREYLKYKKQEEDEYRRTLMIKSQIEKEQKYKKAFASIFGN
jgi:hypothetical protein